VEKQPQNIQDGFLNSARRERTLVTVYLVSGAKLTGRIRSFDKFSVVLESSNQEQLIFKHAISTIVLPRALAPLERSAAPAGAPAVPPPKAPVATSEG
jgi:host factor-I protein